MSFSHIYTGPWIYHSHGTVSGATITVSSSYAGFIVAGIAVLVTVAGSASWRIATYAIHQIRSDWNIRDAIYSQQQAILKNSETPGSLIWTLFQQKYAWRHHTIKATRYYHTLGLLVIAIGISGIFSAASILSSKAIRSSTPYFIIQSPTCGRWSIDPTVSLAQWEGKMLSDASNAANYAKNCYNTTGSGGGLCQTYSVPHIPWSTNLNASCPFSNGTCAFSDTAAYELDTGYLDSHDILGINSLASERVLVRKVTTCAPIRARSYLKTENIMVGPVWQNTTNQFVRVYMGALNGTTKYTYQHNSMSQYCQIGYGLQAITDFDSNIWSPIPPIRRSDGQVSLFFFAQNSVMYAYPNDDWLFIANLPYTLAGSTVYDTPYEVAVLGCVDQYQICNPTRPGMEKSKILCTQLSTKSIVMETTGLDLNEYQVATTLPIALSLLESDMFHVVFGRRASALKAQATVHELLQTAVLPNNQWQIEVAGWFAVSLARFQQSLLEYAAGPPNVVEQVGTIKTVPPEDKYGHEICNRQMIRNAVGYENFSTLALVSIIVVSCILIILGWTIDSCVGSVQKRSGQKSKYKRLSWVKDGYLQLQSINYEMAGMDSTQSIPVTILLDPKEAGLFIPKEHNSSD